MRDYSSPAPQGTFAKPHLRCLLFTLNSYYFHIKTAQVQVSSMSKASAQKRVWMEYCLRLSVTLTLQSRRSNTFYEVFLQYQEYDQHRDQ